MRARVLYLIYVPACQRGREFKINDLDSWAGEDRHRRTLEERILWGSGWILDLGCCYAQNGRF